MTVPATYSAGLSKTQKDIMAFVARKGYITSFDAANSLNIRHDCNCDFDKPDGFRRYMATINASVSRSLNRLVERGLLRKVPSRYVGYSTVWVSPDFTDLPPLIKRRLVEVEACFGVSEETTASLDSACKAIFETKGNG